ncbi:dipeptide ABC transporter substrate-binding protein DppE [soil metagenome]
MMKRYLLTILMMTAALAGCGKKEDAGKAAPKKAPASTSGKPTAANTLRINIGTEPASLDPSLITGIPENKVMQAIMEPLVYLNAKSEIQPGVAESWDHNDSYTEWTFKLRANAFWHNGDPVVAGDFVYSVERMLTKTTGAEYASNVYTFLKGGREYYDAGGLDSQAKLAGVEAVDAHTLKYHLLNPTPYFPTVVGFSSWLPLNRNAIEKSGKAWANNADTFVGNGPFRMTSYRSSDKIVADKFDKYWDSQNIFWRQIQFFMISDENTENSAYLSKSLDVTRTVTIPEVNNWKDKKDYYAPEGLGVYFIMFNNTRPPFDDARVRKAFSMAIDRDLIVNKVTRRGEKASRGYIPPAMISQEGGSFRDHAEDLIGPQDIEGARKLLAEAGYGPNKPVPPIEYMYNTSDEHRIIGEQLQSMWAKGLGVDVKLQNVEWGVLKGRQHSGDFQFSRSSWIGDYLDPMTFLELFVSDNSQNDSRMNNKKFDELIEKARSEPDPIAREKMLREAEKIIISDEAAMAPLFSYVLAILVNPDLQGIEYNKVGALQFVRARRQG